MAYNVTRLGGMAFTRAMVENRVALGPDEYTGTVETWSRGQQWGYIKVTSKVTLPLDVQEKLTQHSNPMYWKDPLIYFRVSDVVGALSIYRGLPVRYRLYSDVKGLGALDVNSTVQ